jgi:predicted MFS family arabinose efflux permease
VLLVGFACAGLSAGGTALAPEYLTFMATRALGGFGSSITIGVSFGAAATLYTGPARRRALSLIGASLSLGTALGPSVLTTLSVALGWRGAFAVMAGFAGIGLVLMLLLFPAEEPHGNGRFEFGRILDSYRPLVRDRTMILLYNVWATRAVCWIGMLSFVGAYFSEEHDFSTGAVGAVFLLAGGGYFVGTLLAGGRLGDFNLRSQAVLSLLGMAAGSALLFAIPVGPEVSLAALGVLAISSGIFQVSVLTMVADRTPAGPSTTMVLTETVLSFGAALGGGIGGLLLGIGGFAAMGLGLTLVVLVGATLISRRKGALAIPPASQPT